MEANYDIGFACVSVCGRVCVWKDWFFPFKAPCFYPAFQASRAAPLNFHLPKFLPPYQYQKTSLPIYMQNYSIEVSRIFGFARLTCIKLANSRCLQIFHYSFAGFPQAKSAPSVQFQQAPQNSVPFSHLAAGPYTQSPGIGLSMTSPKESSALDNLLSPELSQFKARQAGNLSTASLVSQVPQQQAGTLEEEI